MSTLQENQSLNAEYERNKKEREMKEEIERLNNIINEIEKYCDELIIYKAVVTKIRELKGVDKE